MLSIPDLHWAAGFLDGEGCFGVNKHGQLRVHVSQNYRDNLDKLVRLFGGKLSRKDQSHIPNHHHELWVWYTSRQPQSAGLMMTLYSLLSPYRQRTIEKALAIWCAWPKKGQRVKERTTHCRNGHEYTLANTYLKPNGARNCRICLHANWIRANNKYRSKLKRMHCA